MNHEQYVACMAEIGYSREVAEGLIRLSKGPTDLALRISNFVPRDDGLYEIWVSGDRDDFYRVSKDGHEFLGTLDDAYDYIYERKRRWREKQARTLRDSQ